MIFFLKVLYYNQGSKVKCLSYEKIPIFSAIFEKMLHYFGCYLCPYFDNIHSTQDSSSTLFGDFVCCSNVSLTLFWHYFWCYFWNYFHTIFVATFGTISDTISDNTSVAISGNTSVAIFDTFLALILSLVVALFLALLCHLLPLFYDSHCL